MAPYVANGQCPIGLEGSLSRDGRIKKLGYLHGLKWCVLQVLFLFVSRQKSVLVLKVPSEPATAVWPFQWSSWMDPLTWTVGLWHIRLKIHRNGQLVWWCSIYTVPIATKMMALFLYAHVVHYCIAACPLTMTMSVPAESLLFLSCSGNQTY